MTVHPLVLALSIAALLPFGAHAQDLLQTYQLARDNDPLLSMAEAQHQAAQELPVQARAALLPQIDGSASVGRSRSYTPGGEVIRDPITGQPIIDPVTGLPLRSNSTVETDSRSRRVGINLSQMVFDRANISRLQAATAQSRAADFTLESAGDTLITRTSAAYFNTLVAIETLAAAEAAEEALKKQFDLASRRLEVGLAPITDVHEAQAQYDGARANTVVVRNALQDAYQALVEITGQPIRNLQGLPQDFQPQLPAQRTGEQWVQSAMDNNPDLMAQQFNLQAAEANVETARAGHWPRLYFSGSYDHSRSWTDTDLGNGFGSDTDNQSHGPGIGLTLSVPIFSGGAVQSGVRQALANRDAEQDRLEQVRRGLVRNTRNAYQTLVAGVSEVEARRSAVVSAQSAYEASQVGLEVGTRTVVDVLLNQQTLFNAEREYALARYNYLQNLLLLEQAAGSLDVDDVQDVNRLLTVDAEARLTAPLPAARP